MFHSFICWYTSLYLPLLFKDVLYWLYQFNQGGDQSSGIVQTGLLLHSIYTMAFICLLRVDEVLNIQSHHIQHDHLPGEQPHMVLTLPFHKMHQYGGEFCIEIPDYIVTQTIFWGIEPFVLYPLHQHEAHLCPVCTYAKWIKHSGINTGYIFHCITHGCLHMEKPLVGDLFNFWYSNLTPCSSNFSQTPASQCVKFPKMMG